MKLREKINKYKTQYEEGFLESEIEKLLLEYPNINMEKYDKALGVITGLMTDDGFVTLKADVELAIRCGIEDRDPYSIEFD